MFSLTIIVVIVLVLWLGGFAYYLYLSRRQENIADALNSVEKLLDREVTDSSEG